MTEQMNKVSEWNVKKFVEWHGSEIQTKDFGQFRWRDLEYLAGLGVNRVDCVLFVMRLLLVAQLVMESRYGCMIVSAVL